MNIINNLSEKLYIDEEDFILNEPRVKKNFKITDDSLVNGNFKTDNSKLEIYKDRGFKFGDYAEFFIRNTRSHNSNSNGNS